MAYFDARANSVTTVELPRVISELIRVRNITHSVPCEEPLSRKQAPASGMKSNGAEYTNGTILDPRDGDLYSAMMTLTPDGQSRLGASWSARGSAVGGASGIGARWDFHHLPLPQQPSYRQPDLSRWARTHL